MTISDSTIIRDHEKIIRIINEHKDNESIKELQQVISHYKNLSNALKTILCQKLVEYSKNLNVKCHDCE